MEQTNVSFRKRWRKAHASKTVVFWAMVGAMSLTMIVGFNWGGWVTEYTAKDMGEKMAKEAVVQRLASICVLQFNQDPEKAEKLITLKEADSYRKGDYVRSQGWATMHAEERPDNKVANACAKLLVQNSP